MPATEQPDSGAISYRDGRTVITRRYECDSQAEADALIPAPRSLQADGYLLAYSIRPRVGGYFSTEIEYIDSLGGTGGSVPDATEEDYVEARTIERPIGEHPDYLRKWNYDLYYNLKDEFPAEGPSWYDTATDSSDDSDEWMWAQSSPGDKWGKFAERTKDADSYQYPAPVVVSYYYHRTKATAEAQLLAVGTIQTPPDDFGYTGLSWLVIESTLRDDGGKYVVVTRYQGAPAWDADIYS